MSLIKLEMLTWPEVRDLLGEGKTTLLLPVGTIEAHGLHAPIGTDNFCAEEIAWRMGERLGWPVAPTLNYGITTGLIAYPGAVRIEKELYSSLIKSILLNFFEMGFRRIVIINGHGGNTEALTNVAKELIAADRGKRHLIIIDWWQLDSQAIEEVYGGVGGHAALDETACMVAFRPETVKPEAFDPAHRVVFQPGVVSLPYPASMLVYSEGNATPDFDPEKARVFMDKVLDNIEMILSEEVKLFERTFGGSE
jgi:creatinine amidohydrolase